MGRLLVPLMLLSVAIGSHALPRLMGLGEVPEQAVKAHTDDSLQWRMDPQRYETEGPLIGVLSQQCTGCPGKSYIGAAYMKWIEGAGARPVPIKYYSSDAELRRVFDSINGLILPGGMTDIWLDDPYTIAAQKLFTWAVEANLKGDVFPIHGTCLGHQLLQVLTANVSFPDLLITTDSVVQRTTLEFTEESNGSRLFSTMSADLKAKLGDEAQKLAFQNHEFGVPAASFDKFPVLKDNWNILTFSSDRNGTQYISTIEHKSLPFTGTQWHPEKPPYEFTLKGIPHSLDAVRVAQHLANVFVDYARASTHRPASMEEGLAMLINNYPPIFTAREQIFEPEYDGPDITYFFDGAIQNFV